MALTWVKIGNLKGPTGAAGNAVALEKFAALEKGLAAAVLRRGNLPSGADLNTYQGEAFAGIWSAPTGGVVASILNAPPGLLPFTVEVRPNSNGLTKQILASYGSTFGTWSRATNGLTGTTWSPWKQDAYKGDNPVDTLADGADLNALREYGDFQALTTGKVATLVNAPDAQPFILQVRPMVGQNIVAQTLVSFGMSGNYWYRITTSVSSGNWTPWRALHSPSAGAPSTGTPSADTPAGPFQREVLTSGFNLRRGGTIGTGGRSAVALRFDHGLGNFRDLILPLLRKYDLPWSQVVNSQNIGRAENGGASWADLQDWALAHGGEVWNHGATHGDATTESAIFSEIVTGLAELKALVPRLVVEGWAPPGLADGGYMGAAGFSKPEQFYGTYAGRLMMAHHAAVAGYVPGVYRPMTREMPVGSTHVTMDSASASTMRNILNSITAMPEPVALQLMLHPSLVGTETHVTVETVDTILADIARRRDAGELLVLSPSGLLLTDGESNKRHGLLTNGSFKSSAAGWVSTDWQWISDGLISTSSTQPLTQTFTLYRRDHFKGSMRDLTAEVRMPAGGSVSLTVSGTGFSVTKTYTVPAGDAWVPLHRVFTLPADTDIEPVSVSVRRISGGALSVRYVDVLAI